MAIDPARSKFAGSAMSDDDLRTLHQRISAIRERDGEPEDHYYVCVMLSDFAALPFSTVFEACAEL